MEPGPSAVATRILGMEPTTVRERIAVPARDLWSPSRQMAHGGAAVAREAELAWQRADGPHVRASLTEANLACAYLSSSRALLTAWTVQASVTHARELRDVGVVAPEGERTDRVTAFLERFGSTDGAPRARLRHRDLTIREIEILTLIGEGQSDREIGEPLYIGPKTASVHVANVKAKLGALTRLDLALRARELGLTGHARQPTTA